jgi:hypothetical protein
MKKGTATRKLTKEFISANVLETTVEHNGCQGGDAGHGGFVRITFRDLSCTSMEVNGVECEEFSFEFQGSAERETLINSLEMILDELKNNNRV